MSPVTIELSADGTKAAVEAWDDLFDAVAYATERGLTWADTDGEHQAAIVAPEFGLFVELLMRRDTRIRAEIIHPDGTRQDISGGPDDCSTDIQVQQSRPLPDLELALPSSRDPEGQS